MDSEATDSPPERLLYLELEETPVPEQTPSEPPVELEAPVSAVEPAEPVPGVSGFERLMPPGVSPLLVILGICGVLLIPSSVGLLRGLLFEALLFARMMMFPLILLGAVIVALGVLRTRLRR